ncbi:hypothetical protein [Rhodopirellula sp. SWK7]|uniref:hypothetical protein n=1 Tax=Rhodopirellula sp. SWK7 TaxID=595460 RepID=UPI0002BE9E8F|nr:hypothetical protein [Rhodopirellula sp. SWK7]EMI41660.1 hypothetical protein RRSWK_05832 [Rhodopirellula sp. SWK7]
MDLKHNLTSLAKLAKQDGIRSALHYGLSRLGEVREQTLERNYLVTGCGGSGTTYAYRMLYENNIRVSHDRRLGRDGIVTNACDGTFVSVYDYGTRNCNEHIFCKISVKQFRKTLLLVRNPLLTIGSVRAKWNKNDNVWRHILNSIGPPSPNDHDLLLYATKYWIDWNTRLRPVASKTYRFEDILENNGPFLNEFGIKRPATKQVPPTASSGTKSYPTLEEIQHRDKELADRLAQRAFEFGYELT